MCNVILSASALLPVCLKFMTHHFISMGLAMCGCSACVGMCLHNARQIVAILEDVNMLCHIISCTSCCLGLLIHHLAQYQSVVSTIHQHKGSRVCG